MSWKQTLNAVLKAHNKAAACGGKAVGFATQEARRATLEQGFTELRALGYKLPDVRGFKERHMTALGHAWEAKGLSASTIQNRISIFRVFAEWIGKTGMIRGSEHYVKNPKSVERHYIAQEDKTWSGKGVDIESKLASVKVRDPFVGMQLALSHAFGLRPKESMLLKPHGADKGNYLAVHWGTKGGRARPVPIETPYQRAILEQAKTMITNPTSSMIPPGYNFKQWKDHYYYVCRKEGICRNEETITPHGLRHERLNQVYEEKTGCCSPVKGGNANLIDRVAEKAARQEIAEIAGHSRESIASAYVGSLRKFS